MKTRILVVDDEILIRESLAFVLRKEGFVVEEAENGARALELIKAKSFDVAISDIEMPEMKGIELLKKIQEFSPQTSVILITAYASIDTAIKALRNGAYDYILKPIEFDDLLNRINKLNEHKNLISENIHLRSELHKEYDFNNIIGKSPAMQKVFDLIKKVASSEGTILITGDSGTGKEIVARAIHYNSKRSSRRFVAINCGAIVETLFESELFGHKKGSFTGAISDKDGLFKIADEGTIFLDEVSEIPQHLQVKLLRTIEEKEILPVGGVSQVNVNVRIIAASNKDIKELVNQGKFREDLFYRLNVVEIHLPSLEERKEDIGLLIHHFIDKHGKKMGKHILGVTNEVVRILTNHKWKGQVRELENIIERALIFSESDYITINDLPEVLRIKSDVKFTQDSKKLKDKLKEFEKYYIEQQLANFNSDKEKTAIELGISISSLYRKIEELKING